MVQLKQKNGIVPISWIIFGIIIIALIFITAKSTNLLSISIGIEDDYMTYDDFSSGYFDVKLWNFTNSKDTATCLQVKSSPYDNLTVVDGNLVASVSFGNIGSCNSIGGVQSGTLIPRENLYGKYIKLKYYPYNVQYDGSKIKRAKNTLILNDVIAFDYMPKIIYGEEEKSYLVELIPSFENPAIYQVRLNGEDYAVVNTTNPRGDRKFKINMDIRASGDGGAVGLISFKTLDYLKYKIPYSCKIETDEVLVFDSFESGSKVNISNLAFKPVKFCLDYPVKARSFAESGIKTDVRGEILQKIVKGQSASVPNNEEWKVFYITKYESGMNLRCGISQSYNTRTKKCEDTVEKAIVGCVKNDDCYVPDGCFGLSATCQNFNCVYQGKCEKTYVDYCQSDFECVPSCQGVKGSCKNPDSLGNRCFFEGSCDNIQCKVDSDCAAPLCQGVTASCDNFRCEYSGSCAAPTVNFCQSNADCVSQGYGQGASCLDTDSRGTRCMIDGKILEPKTEIIEKIVKEIETVEVEKTIIVENDNYIDRPVYVEVPKYVEVYADKCQKDSECETPCDGMSGYCKNIGYGKECHYSGKCKENVKEINSTVVINNTVFKDRIVYINKPGFISKFFNWILGIF